MKSRILRDIRYYEVKPEGYSGKFDGSLGNIFLSTTDTHYIGQRIARKLNEMSFVSGLFDHIYINLSDRLESGNIVISDNYGDERISTYDYGINSTEFNARNDIEKDNKIKEITFEVLKSIYKSNQKELNQIESALSLISKEGKDIKINYKTKETKIFKVDVSFQIAPTNGMSKIIIGHLDKATGHKKSTSIELNFYEDIYSLIKSISVKANSIVFTPFDTNYAKLAIEKYKTPLMINLDEME